MNEHRTDYGTATKDNAARTPRRAPASTASTYFARITLAAILALERRYQRAERADRRRVADAGKGGAP
jgi:hypothetical protein